MTTVAWLAAHHMSVHMWAEAKVMGCDINLTVDDLLRPVPHGVTPPTDQDCLGAGVQSTPFIVTLPGDSCSTVRKARCWG